MHEGYGHKESYELIAADKVEGTAAYDMARNKLGTNKNIMIDKVSGEVVLATMAYAGVLGVSQKYNVLPWTALTYNADLGGYQLDVDREKLEAGPAATEEELLQKTQDRGWVYSVYDYYASAYDAFLVSNSMLRVWMPASTQGRASSITAPCSGRAVCRRPSCAAAASVTGKLRR